MSALAKLLDFDIAYRRDGTVLLTAGEVNEMRAELVGHTIAVAARTCAPSDKAIVDELNERAAFLEDDALPGSAMLMRRAAIRIEELASAGSRTP